MCSFPRNVGVLESQTMEMSSTNRNISVLLCIQLKLFQIINFGDSFKNYVFLIAEYFGRKYEMPFELDVLELEAGDNIFTHQDNFDTYFGTNLLKKWV